MFLLRMIFAVALAAPAAALGAAGPGEAAVRFLEHVRAGTLNLEAGGDTALTAQTGDRKRREIERRLERLARDLGDDPLEIGPIREDGELAAVLVRKTGGFDPNLRQVVPVALVRRNDSWIPTPLPASFQNSGLGYSPDLRRRILLLESWMLRERGAQLESLRQQAERELRDRIRSHITEDEIRAMSPATVAARFLESCRQGDLPVALGLLGALATEPPADWPERLRTAENAIRNPARASGVWRSLVAPEVIRVPVFHDDDQEGLASTVYLACLDPTDGSSRARIPLFELQLRKSADDLWRVDLPAEAVDESAGDASLLDLFPAKLALLHPPGPAASPAALRDTLLAALRTADPAAWLRLLRLTGDPEDQRLASVRAARLWWELRNPEQPVHLVALDLHQSENGELAAIACQVFSSLHPDRADIRLLVLEHTPMGWLWNPEPSRQSLRHFEEWNEARRGDWIDGWRAALLADCPPIDNPAEAPAPTAEQARQLAGNWLEAITRGDITAALRLTARLRLADSDSHLLRNLGYEISGIRRMSRPPDPVDSLAGRHLAAAAIRAEADGKVIFPLLPVVSTPAGPRILLEINLIASTAVGRQFLNRSSIERLRKADRSAADDLAALFAEHRERSLSAKEP